MRAPRFRQFLSWLVDALFWNKPRSAPPISEQEEAKRAFLAKAIETLEDDDRNVLFTEYSQWARHYHTLVWTSAAFGTTIALGGLAGLWNAHPIAYTVVVVGSIALLLVMHALAQGNRLQWEDGMRVVNAIEMKWGVRDPSNKSSLAPRTGPPHPQFTKIARTWLLRVSFWLAVSACIAKWWTWLLQSGCEGT